MKELIKEAEKLYEEIDTIQMLWVASTKDNDEEGIRYAIGRMSVAMCSAMQLLKCFIDRKDNIVDLSEVWHNETEKPDGGKLVLLDTCDGYIVRTLASANDEKWRCLAGNEVWASFVYIHSTKRWAYIKDLLPKGGE